MEQKTAATRAAIKKNSPDGITRAARSRTCGRCRRAVFEGLDADHAAAVARVDPAPLGAHGELQALMTGRQTYSLTWIPGRGRYEIDPRTQYTITANPPGTDTNTDVVVAHQCGAPPLPTMTTTIRRTNKTNATPIDPPF